MVQLPKWWLVALIGFSVFAEPAKLPVPTQAPRTGKPKTSAFETANVQPIAGNWKSAYFESPQYLPRRFYRTRFFQVSGNDITYGSQYFDPEKGEKPIADHVMKGHFVASRPKLYPKLISLEITTTENKFSIYQASGLADALHMQSCAKENAPADLTKAACGVMPKEEHDPIMIVYTMDGNAILLSTRDGDVGPPRSLNSYPLVKN